MSDDNWMPDWFWDSIPEPKPPEPEPLTPEQRRKRAKMVNFGLAYGHEFSFVSTPAIDFKVIKNRVSGIGFKDQKVISFQVIKNRAPQSGTMDIKFDYSQAELALIHAAEAQAPERISGDGDQADQDPNLDPVDRD